jgi:predicted RNase H-like HicB family nuclease
MKQGDRYHKWVEWSEEEGVYLGKCPDLITGIHGSDPIQLYSELNEVIEEVIDYFQKEGRTLPQPKVRPMQEVA